MTEGTYNGWTNRETWVVHTHFDIAFAQLDLHGADTLKGFVQDSIGLIEDSFVSDLLTSALARVNWKELDEHCNEPSAGDGPPD